ncbi:uncharcterized protein [Sporisorium scitamineum]|uniref:Uncharcterized protein n=1 Tax=Sporisorium scitamineum TaxID=49012 RepID=A0A127Z5F6_9BASI|nr:uncharcterized protein [Sporisorium scitamineum]
MLFKNFLVAILAAALALSSVVAVRLQPDVVIWEKGSAPNTFWLKIHNLIKTAEAGNEAMPRDALQAFYRYNFGTSALYGTRPAESITGTTWNDWYPRYLEQLRNEIAENQAREEALMGRRGRG